MKLDANFSTTTEYTRFLEPNSKNDVNVNQFNFNFGDTSRLNNLMGNNQPTLNTSGCNQNNQPQNSAAMDFFKTMFTGFAKMLGLDPQKLMQAFGMNQPQQPTNTQNFSTGAGAINKVGGKSADKQNDPLIKQAMEQMQAEQAASPGKAVKRTIKGSDGKKYKLSLDENGQMNIKKKGGGFLGGLLKGIGNVFKTGLSLVSQFGSFIPGWGTLASMGSSLLLNVMNKKQ
jgi:hypothetical protein